jgi:tRNA pseudouridine32 synthase/23S rRNA pseudouridine746 synthase
MGIAKTPSKVSLPEAQSGIQTVYDYLVIRFPAISAGEWRQRMVDGKVHWHNGELISQSTPYRAKQRVYYYREVANEIEIPFKESIIFENEHLLVAHKPHFLPVTPGGKYVNECLLARLREATGCAHLQPLHRLDRATAGLVMFSNNSKTLPLYSQLFEDHLIQKTYQAIGYRHFVEGSPSEAKNELIPGKVRDVKNRIEKVPGSFHMQIETGVNNSHSTVHCIKQRGDHALFELSPITGKTHQLRLHMQALGWPILNDKTYPTLQPESADDYSLPLQLLAKSLTFTDPVTQQLMNLSSEENLTLS